MGEDRNARARALRLRDLRPRARALIIGLVAAGAAATAAAQAAGDVPPVDPLLLGLTAALCLAAGFFEVPSPGSPAMYPATAFVFWGALLLPPVVLPLLCGLSFVPMALRARVRWYAPACLAATYVLAALPAGPLGRAGGLPEDLHTGPALLVALAVAAAGFVGGVAVLRALILCVAWRRPLAGAVRRLLDNLPLELALATTGASLAVLWSVDPWLAACLAGPIALLFRAMLVPALRHKSRTDPKTGLYNFEHLRAALDDAVRGAGRRDEQVAVVMVDLDHLRTVNNRFGHLAGDQAIGRVASLLGDAAQHRGLAARFGGEEFCLMLPGASAHEAEAVVDGVRMEVQDLAWERDGEVLRCSFSAGVAVFPQDGDTPEALLSAADAALYDAKSGGRNRVRLALPAGAREDLDLAAALAAVPDEPVAAPAPLAAPVAVAPPPAEPEDEPEPEPEPEDAPPASARYIPLLVAVLLCGLVAVVVVSLPPRFAASPVLLVLLVAAVLAFDLVRIDVFEGLNLSAASVPTLALACVFGPLGPVCAEATIAGLRLARREPRLKWSFDLGALGLCGAAAAAVFTVLPTHTPLMTIFAGLVAGLAYYIVNVALMTTVLSLAHGIRPLAAWRENLAWLWAHFVLYGILAGSLVVTEQALGTFSIALFALPVVALWVAQRQYVARSRATLVALRRSHERLERANRQQLRLLDEKRELLARVHGSYLSTITSLARTIEAKDPHTGGHTERVSRLTTLLAEELGFAAPERRAAEVGAALHDIGKVGVPDHILLKPAPLTEVEVEVMRRHPEVSSHIVGALDLPPVVKEMVRSHHERYDGGGYPDSLSGEEIPLAARVLAVADTLDAMTSDRPYRSARPLGVALAEIDALAGEQFCPTVVRALHSVLARDATLGGMFCEQAGMVATA